MYFSRINRLDADSIFFDFDGVIVDSVEIKTKAYEKIFRPFGIAAVNSIRQYHLDHGGIDRYKKIQYVMEKLSLSNLDIKSLATEFENEVVDQVIQAPFLYDILEFLVQRKFAGKNDFIVSGTPEKELKKIVKKKGLKQYFLEIRGSPDPKDSILRKLIKKYSIDTTNSIFIGDANTDFEAAKKCGILFIGVPPSS